MKATVFLPILLFCLIWLCSGDVTGLIRLIEVVGSILLYLTFLDEETAKKTLERRVVQLEQEVDLKYEEDWFENFRQI